MSQLLATVITNGLNVRTGPTSQSTIVTSFARGTALNCFEIVEGENVSGNPRWGHSLQGHFFWLGGTDHPNGVEQAVRVTLESLNARMGPSTQAERIASHPRGTVLNYYRVVEGESVSGNPRWGHSAQGYYFWLGGTDHPQG